MTTHKEMTVNVVEIRHHGETIRYKVDSLDDYVSGVVTTAAGKPVSFDRQAKELEGWFKQAALEGVEARAATITLPPVTLDILFENPGHSTNLSLGSVCSTYHLFQETRASGAEGTVFTTSDISGMLAEADNDDYNDLSDEEKEQFARDYFSTFTKRLDDQISARGHFHIENMISDELDDCLDDFKRRRHVNGM